MTKISFFFAFIIGTTSLLFSSCNNTNSGIPIQGNDNNTKVKTNTLLNIFNNGIPIDSTTIIMYPLSLGIKRDENIELKRYSKGSDSPFWNIAFYDSNTKRSTLLDSNRTFMINSFQKLKEIIVYSVCIKDFNGNGKFDDRDPVYLFTSDLKGNGFKQITPDNLDASSFNVIDNSDVILIHAISDNTKDRKFDDNDRIIPMIFDRRKADVAKGTFSTSFNEKVNRVFKNLYKQ